MARDKVTSAMQIGATPESVKLQRLSSVEDPMMLDVKGLQQALIDAEIAGVAIELVEVARGKLHQAVHEQMKSRLMSAERQLRELCASTPTSLDEWWVTYAGLLRVIPDGEQAGLDQALLGKAKIMLRQAEQAKASLSADRRTLAMAELQRLAAMPLALCNTAELRDALANAAKTGVGQEGLEPAQKKLEAAFRRDALGTNLRSLGSTDPLQLDLNEVRLAWGDAAQAGVAKDIIKEVQQHLRFAGQAQARRDAAATRLESMSAIEALRLDISAMRQALPTAEQVHVPNAVLGRAEEALLLAEQAQSRQDAATAALLLAAAPSPMNLNVAALKAMLKEAEAAGVAKVSMQLAQVGLVASLCLAPRYD